MVRYPNYPKYSKCNRSTKDLIAFIGGSEFQYRIFQHSQGESWLHWYHFFVDNPAGYIITELSKPWVLPEELFDDDTLWQVDYNIIADFLKWAMENYKE